jgi:hypothetical protein
MIRGCLIDINDGLAEINNYAKFCNEQLEGDQQITANQVRLADGSWPTHQLLNAKAQCLNALAQLAAADAAMASPSRTRR